MRAACAIAVVAAVLAVAPGAAAHPSALSTFDARTDGKDVLITFLIDATSVVDLIGRASGGVLVVDKPAIPDHAATVVAYLDGRFSLGNGEARCQRTTAQPLVLDVATDKVRLDTRYHCGAELVELRFLSTLFHDEDTPHQVIGTVRHAALLERYFFLRGQETARVDLRNVPLPAAGTIGSRQFRMATPPPGAFAPRPAPPVAVAAAVAPSPVAASAPPPTRGAHIELTPAAPEHGGTSLLLLVGCAAALGLGVAAWRSQRRS
jgi:hypothetical protein